MQQNAPFCVLPTAFSLSRVGMYVISVKSNDCRSIDCRSNDIIPNFRLLCLGPGHTFFYVTINVAN